jgi:hypothetical protein
MAWFGRSGEGAPYALLAVALACAAIAGALASLLAGDLGLSPWLGLVIVVNPGLIFAVANLTSEAAGLAALLASIYLWRRENRCSFRRAHGRVPDQGAVPPRAGRAGGL